jgi:hypothetical protein
VRQHRANRAAGGGRTARPRPRERDDELPGALVQRPKLWPYKAISPTTVDYVADGRVFATGLASNTHDSQIVQADLAQIADEIAG